MLTDGLLPERSHRTNLRSILSNGCRLAGINWFETALSIVYFAVMARFLGPTLYGYWAYGIAAYALTVGLAGLGFDTLVILRLGHDKRGGGEFLGLILSLRFAILCLGSGGFAGYALMAETDPLSRLVLLLLVPALLGRGVSLAVRMCFVAYERMADYARFVAWFRAAEAICGIIYLSAGGGLIGLVVLHALAWIGEASFGLCRIHSRLTRYSLPLEWGPAATLLRQAAVLGLSTAANAWLSSGPIMMLRYSPVGMASVGRLAMVLSFAMILVGSAYAFFTAALPVLSRSARQANIEMCYGRVTALAILAAAAAGAWIAGQVGPPLVRSALGVDYAAAGDLLAPFMLICGVILVPTAYCQTLLLAGHRWLVVLADLAGGLCLALAFFPAVGRWGLAGAVSAIACSWLVRAALLIGMGEKFGSRGFGMPVVLARPVE
jgi:O-antigen/teichoic acid export membrane protein